jgi:acyl-coenzyme A thioesterase PaaI-like protein
MLPLEMGLESRLIQRGAAGGDQPLGRVWVRHLAPVVAGGARHPVIAAVLAADFGGSLSSGVEREKWTSPNVDIAIHFLRPPRDEWVLVEARALLLGNGGALIESELSDRSGLFAHVNLTLVLAPADPSQKVAWP